jgi:tRNA-2-methylthio-N6-dimethylallyladenosine synthase
MGLKKKTDLMLKKIFIKTFGCQMNEYDSNRILDTVKKIGFEKTEKYENANCYLLNTCHIRDKAKEKVYHEIGRVKKIFRFKKKPIVIVAGCVAQAENQEMLKREPYIDIVVGPQSYHKINEAILKHTSNKKKEEETEFDTISKFNYLSKIKNKNSKVSSFLTIQEGCDKFCHFCVVPYTRGPEYSRPFNQIINEAKEIIKSGTKEIILLGQNVNAYSYRDKSKEFRLSDLLFELEGFDGLERIRYTTSHPKDMTDDLINFYKKSTKLMPLVHLPVQSGSNKILKLMNRKHTIEEYLMIYEKLKKINPNIEFSSDFIIGYPDENDDDFKYTMKLIEKIRFINSYSFIFSPRPGTVAADLELINKKKSKERLEIIQKKLSKNQIDKNKSLEGKILNVLVENKMKDGIKLFGRTEYMTSVIFNGNTECIGKIVQIEISSSNQNSLFGVLKENYKQKVA